MPGGGFNAGEALHGNDLAAGLATGKGPQQRQQRLEACARPHLHQQRQAEPLTRLSMEKSPDTHQLGPARTRLQRHVVLQGPWRVGLNPYPTLCYLNKHDISSDQAVGRAPARCA